MSRALGLAPDLRPMEPLALSTWNLLVGRIEEAVREIAVLFIALAPLDAVLGADRPNAVRNGLIFGIIGIILFLLALLSERRREWIRS